MNDRLGTIEPLSSPLTSLTRYHEKKKKMHAEMEAQFESQNAALASLQEALLRVEADRTAEGAQPRGLTPEASRWRWGHGAQRGVGGVVHDCWLGLWSHAFATGMAASCQCQSSC